MTRYVTAYRSPKLPGKVFCHDCTGPAWEPVTKVKVAETYHCENCGALFGAGPVEVKRA